MKPMHHVYFLTDRLRMGKALNCLKTMAARYEVGEQTLLFLVL